MRNFVMRKVQRMGFLFGLVVLLAACAGETAVPTAPPTVEVEAPQETSTAVPPTQVATTAPPPNTPTAVPPADSAAAPTATTAAAPPTPTETASLITSGRTAEGAYFRGNPDAPLTMIDYSDFL